MKRSIGYTEPASNVRNLGGDDDLWDAILLGVWM